jgi:hypothetical protein
MRVADRKVIRLLLFSTMLHIMHRHQRDVASAIRHICLGLQHPDTESFSSTTVAEDALNTGTSVWSCVMES